MTTAELPEFTIVFVDDSLKSINQQIRDIETYLRDQKGRKLIQLLDEESGSKVDEYLAKHRVDIVVTDNSMKNEGDGIKVIEKVRNKNNLIDILLYTAKGLKLDDYRQACIYTAVSIVDDKNFVDGLMTLIDRNLAKWGDVLFLRGMIISETINLEIAIDDLFHKYFDVSKRAGKLFGLMLEGTVMTLNTKKGFLVQIIRENRWDNHEDIDEMIKDIEFERNILAHAEYDHANNQFISRKSGGQKFGKKRMSGTLEKINTLSGKLAKFSGAVDVLDAEIKKAA